MKKGLISADKIEEITRKADIVELVAEYVTLKKKGKDFFGLCPFHNEKTPSFKVSREKQMYYCFGCGEGGHVFTFFMKMNNIAFPEAARLLAKKTGVIIPEQPLTAKEQTEYQIFDQIKRINEVAASFFVKNLHSPSGRKARDYLKMRGIRDDVADAFRLGYAENAGNSLKNFFNRRQISLKLAAQAGLLASREDASEADFYDRFRERLIFPIEDVGNRVIAFGGRVIGNRDPKYLNSPETVLFKKGRNLYGLNKARESIRKQGFAILVEGYFDLIALWNVGITHVVATLGTALTKEQVELLRRYTGQVAVLFDPDEAGRKALERSLQLFLAAGVQARTVVLPEKCDPDEYVKRFGRDRLEEFIAQAPSMVDYYVDTMLGERSGLEQTGDAAREALAFVAGIEDIIERNLFLKRISEKLGVDQEVLKREANRNLESLPSKAAIAGGKGDAAFFDKLEFSLILAMLESPHLILQVEDKGILDYVLSDDLKTLGKNIIAFSKKGVENKGATYFLDCIDEGPLKRNLVQSLLEESAGDEEVLERCFADIVRQIKRKWYKSKSNALRKELVIAQEKGDYDLCSQLIVEKERLLKEAKSI